jgi:hypothetical protein
MCVLPGVFVCGLVSCSSSSPASGAGAASADSCAPASVSFQKDVLPTFAANCTSTTICHGQTGDPLVENLYLGAAGASEADDGTKVYAGLVNVLSIEDPAMNLVSPGSLEKSYLWHKVAGDQNADSTVMNGCKPVASGPTPCTDCLPEAPCGVQMPLGTLLDSASTCVIKNWIAGGAKGP